MEEEGVNEKRCRSSSRVALLGDQVTKFTTEIGFKGFQNATKSAPPRSTTCVSRGTSCSAYFFACMARTALREIAAGNTDPFYQAKLQTARFYFQRILPRTRTHVATMLSGANNLMDMKEEHFALGY